MIGVLTSISILIAITNAQNCQPPTIKPSGTYTTQIGNNVEVNCTLNVCSTERFAVLTADDPSSYNKSSITRIPPAVNPDPCTFIYRYNVSVSNLQDFTGLYCCIRSASETLNNTCINSDELSIVVQPPPPTIIEESKNDLQLTESYICNASCKFETGVYWYNAETQHRVPGIFGGSQTCNSVLDFVNITLTLSRTLASPTSIQCGGYWQDEFYGSSPVIRNVPESTTSPTPISTPNTTQPPTGNETQTTNSAKKDLYQAKFQLVCAVTFILTITRLLR